MIKFILIMFICSNIPGNSCKLMTTPIQEFDTYRECAIYGYEYSFNLLKILIRNRLMNIKCILRLIVKKVKAFDIVAKMW